MGVFLVIYGPNNLGKSTQFDLLEQHWMRIRRPYMRIKYPIYDSPTGRLINGILRPPEGVVITTTEKELQGLFAEDRRCFEPTLKQLLTMGDVLAEDYVGTGLAWGLTRGVPRKDLDRYNIGLLRPDVEILLDGDRFSGGIERGHRNEAAGQETWERNRLIHQELAREFGWIIVSANGNPETVHENVLKAISVKLGEI